MLVASQHLKMAHTNAGAALITVVLSFTAPSQYVQHVQNALSLASVSAPCRCMMRSCSVPASAYQPQSQA